jgi:hypothetical protein
LQLKTDVLGRLNDFEVNQLVCTQDEASLRQSISELLHFLEIPDASRREVIANSLESSSMLGKEI